MKKIAVVLLNLGGPESLKTVKPFLYNLFSDEKIIRLPWLPRKILAFLISTLRAKKAEGIYQKTGGKSPLYEFTKLQAEALEKRLNGQTAGEIYKIFIAMRHWHPFTREAVDGVMEWGADEAVLLPLYPQFSGSTTGSSFLEWDRTARKSGFSKKTSRICCYPQDPDLIEAHSVLLQNALNTGREGIQYEILFSAHGIPEDFVAAGDPYQHQIRLTCEAIIGNLKKKGFHNLSFQITYQSKVGFKKWLEPATDAAVIPIAQKKRGIVIVPVSFVSEHSETLVELDMDYKILAGKNGCPDYKRVPALGENAFFIKCLTGLVLGTQKRSGQEKNGFCGQKFKECPHYQ